MIHTVYKEEQKLERRTFIPAGALDRELQLSGERPQDQTEEARTTRDNYYISPELDAKIQMLAQDMEATIGEVLRKSVALMDLAIQARKQGKKVGIADRSEQLTTEIVGWEL